MIDSLALHHYGLMFSLRFREARGDSFQQFFGQVMNAAHPGDFVQTRPWGRKGDEKCDGYLSSKRCLYACYAPNELTESATLSKMRDDFDGALPAAGQFFDEWVFVHNAPDGRIPTWLVKEIEKLRTQHPNLSIGIIGFEELRQVVFRLSGPDLVSLLGPAPTQRDMLSLGIIDLQPLLKNLANQAPPEDVQPSAVSGRKLAHNHLSTDVAALFKAGMAKASLIESYISRGQNKELGMHVGTAFRKRYAELAVQGLDGDEIFNHLLDFAIGPFRPEPGIQMAAYAVLAWLFESCDIFETPHEQQ